MANWVMYSKYIRTLVLIFCVCFSYTSSAFGEIGPIEAVKKVSLKKEKDIYCLCIDFNEGVAFTPRVHTLPNGVKILLSFKNQVVVPKTKRLAHNLFKGYFFEKFSPTSLIFVAALKESVIFTEKKYTKNSVKIKFRIHKKHTIVIDAGHGGKDPGTKGVTGDWEKNITLIMAIELRNLLINSGKYRVVLTRDKDVFTPITDRIAKIDSSAGELLISLHTDSNNDKNLHGISVYTLPNLDYLKQTNERYKPESDIKNYYSMLSNSRRFSKCLIGFIPNMCKIKNRPCRNVELKILKTNMPAALIELGCISNKTDNELLHSKAFREKTIRAILYALDDFFKKEKQ